MYQTKSIPISTSIKDIDGKKGYSTGYFAHFNSLDSDEDIIEPGSFQKTIKERGPDSTQNRIKHLRNHLPYEAVGVLKVLKEDNIGLYYESQIGSHFVGQDYIKQVESGIITEHSFGFDTIRKEQKGNVRYLKELQMWEGSGLTAWAANERTGAAAMKSMGKTAYLKMITDRANAMEKFCRNTTATDETIEMLLIEHKQLTQIILDISEKSTTPGDESTLPDEIGDAMDLFISSLKN